MMLKELEKWVKEYDLIFKMSFTSHVGCVVEVFKKGFDMPMYHITSDTCVEAIEYIHHLLESKVENGGLQTIESED